MLVLDAKFFGTPSVRVGGAELVLPYKKAEALLYYLILKHRVPRQELAGLLWAEIDSAAALKNLRHAIYSIRKEFPCDPFVPGQRTVLELSPELLVRCDVLEFLQNRDLRVQFDEFLKDFDLPFEPLFDEWLSGERRRLQAEYLKQLLQAEQRAFLGGDLRAAEEYGLRYVTLDPMEESAVTTLMQVCSAQKKFRTAIQLYQNLRQNLSDEFSISPLKETTALYYRIVDDWNRSADRGEERGGCPLVGKDAALRRLLALCGGSAKAQRPAVLIQGEAGVGKTCLLDHVLNQYDASDWLVCRGGCYQTEMTSAMFPWNTILMELMSELEARQIAIPENDRKIAAALFPCLLPPPNRDYDLAVEYPVQANYHAAQESMLLILSMVVKKAPLLLVFEDIHWMDPASARLLGLFLRRMQGLSAAVICTGRDELPDHVQTFVELAMRDWLLDRCPIEPFSLAQTRQFVSLSLGREVSPELLERLFRCTDGNALLLVQLLDCVSSACDPEDTLPDFDSIIEQRLAALSPEERQTLNAVCVFTGWVPFEVLCSILTKDALELMALCDQLRGKKLLEESEQNGELGYSLAHEKIKDILVKQQPQSGRRLLHLRAAQCLEGRLDHTRAVSYNQIIYHYSNGGDRFKAFKYQVLSLHTLAGFCCELLPTLVADSEVIIPSEDELTSYFETLNRELALLRASYLGSGREELEQLESILMFAESRYCTHHGQYKRGFQLLERLLERHGPRGDSEMLIKIHLQFIFCGIQTYDAALIEPHLELCGALLSDRRDSADWGVYLRLYGQLKLIRGCYPESRDWLERSIQLFRRLDPRPDGPYSISIAGAYHYIAETYRLERDFQKAFLYYDLAPTFPKRRGCHPGAAVFYTNYGVAAFQKGERQAALPLFRCAEQLYQTSHSSSEYPIALAYLALYDVQEGQYERAAGRIQEALRISRAFASPWWSGITVYLTWKIRLHLEQAQASAPALERLWPASKREHCQWGLRYLRQLYPRLESEELELALASQAF